MSSAPELSRPPLPRGQTPEGVEAMVAWLDTLPFVLGDVWLSARASEHPGPFLAIVGALLLMLLWRMVAGRRRRPALASVAGRRSCRWRRDRSRRSGVLRRWVCLTCGVDAWTSDRRPPKECKRHLRETRL